MPEPMPANPAFDRFVDVWLRLLNEEDDGRSVVVVEGERDRLSVRRLGWTGPVKAIHEGRTLSRTAHELVLGRGKAILLTDWDAEGGHLAHRLKEFLEAEALELDLDYRREFARILRGELVHVEGLYGWARRQAESAGLSIEWVLDRRVGTPSPSVTG